MARESNVSSVSSVPWRKAPNDAQPFDRANVRHQAWSAVGCRSCRTSRPRGFRPMEQRVPRVGVGVIVLRDGLVLLGKRFGSHAPGTWALPGGHLEFGESVEQCASREVLEETGLHIQRLSPGPYTNDVFATENRHYVTLFVVAHTAPGNPQLREPSKCLSWQWFRWSDLPQPERDGRLRRQRGGIGLADASSLFPARNPSARRRKRQYPGESAWRRTGSVSKEVFDEGRDPLRVPRIGCALVRSVT